MYNYRENLAVYLQNCEGRRYWFDNYEKLLEWLSINYSVYDVKSIIGKVWRERVYRRFCSTNLSEIYYKYYTYVVFNEYHEIIAPDIIYEDVYQKRIKNQKWRYRSFKFRDGPVENIRCYRGGWHYYRQVKTAQEYKENCSLVHNEDISFYKVKIRAKRNNNNLPNAWDDLNHQDYNYKNWKNYRKTQWK